MSYLLFPSSGNHVTLEPEWDFDRNDKKIEDVHRTRAGREYRYKWSSYRVFKFGNTFVTSGVAAVVNSWWDSNTNLLFMKSGDTQVFSVRLVNKDLPFGRFQKPYDDLYQGNIELETY